MPAGSKAVGHIQEADRSGYMRIEFDSLLMPDGSSVSIQAAATDLDLRPIKGKVEGKNTGKTCSCDLCPASVRLARFWSAAEV